MEKWYARDTRRQRSRSFQRHVHRPTSNSSTDPVPCNHLSSPSREIQRSRTPDIYFGDSLSTGSPFKIECLYKSSPIRERVLNARTSPATKSQPEHPACPSSTLFPTTPFPGLSLPLPPLFHLSPSLHPRLTDSIDTQDLPHTTFLCQASDSPASRFFCVSFAARSDKKKGGKGGKREEEGRRGLVCHHRLKGKGRERGLRGGEPARIYWTCLGEESRLVALATRRSPRSQESQLNRSTVPKRF